MNTWKISGAEPTGEVEVGSVMESLGDGGVAIRPASERFPNLSGRLAPRSLRGAL
ncbi:MAG: hypothetical protein ACKVG4_08120 [Longimicrobiales bacterium]